MLELGGVPTEDRFRKLTDVQWAMIMYKYADMKLEKYNIELSKIEYLAQMVSPAGPKAIEAVAATRRANVEKMRKIEDGAGEDGVIAEDDKQIVKRYSIEGEFVNTSFEDAIREAVGDAGRSDGALNAIFGDDREKSVVYTVDKSSLEYLKHSDDLKAKMEKIVQQGNQQPLEEQSGKLNEDEIAALKAMDFDTINF